MERRDRTGRRRPVIGASRRRCATMGGCDRRSRPPRALLRAGFADAAARGAPAGRPGTASYPRRRQRARRVARPRHRSTSTSRPTPGPTRSRRWCGRWADAVWLQGQRFGTVGCEKGGERFEITTFRAEVYRPESRKPEVDVLRRHRDRPVAARLHGQRDGDRARRPDGADRSSIRSTAWPTSRPGGCARRSSPEISFERRPAADAARGAVRRDARLRARRRRSSTRSSRCASGWRSSARSGSATSSRSCSSPTIRRPGCG